MDVRNPLWEEMSLISLLSLEEEKSKSSATFLSSEETMARILVDR